MGKLSAVAEGTFELPSGRVVSVGDDSWFDWLKSPDARSFRFEGLAGHFTARKETPKRGNPYWTAARRLNTKLHKCYLGHSDALELARLEAAAEELANPEIRKSKKPARASDSVTSLEGSVTPAPALSLAENRDFQQLQAQVVELHKQVTELRFELHRKLGNFPGDADPREEEESQILKRQVAEITEERDALRRSNAELEDRLADFAARAGEVYAANQELKQQVTEVTEEREALRQQVAEVTEEREALRQQVAEVTEEREALKQQVAEVTQQLAAAISERDALERTPTTESAPAATESAPPPDLEAITRRVLAGLKLGRQAPGYKVAAKALAEFVKEFGACKMELGALPGEASSQRPEHTFDAARR